MSEKPVTIFDEPIFVTSDKFLRRIPPFHLKKTGQISSAAFQNSTRTNGMSTNWLKLSSVEESIRDFPNFGVASIPAELCWALSQEIEWLPMDDNTAHCEIVGHKTESVSKSFRNGAEYLVLPTRK